MEPLIMAISLGSQSSQVASFIHSYANNCLFGVNLLFNLQSYFYPHQALLVLLECDWLMVSDGSGSSQSCSVEGWALSRTSM